MPRAIAVTGDRINRDGDTEETRARDGDSAENVYIYRYGSREREQREIDIHSTRRRHCIQQAAAQNCFSLFHLRAHAGQPTSSGLVYISALHIAVVIVFLRGEHTNIGICVHRVRQYFYI